VEDEEGSTAHTGHTLNAAASSALRDSETISRSLMHQGKFLSLLRVMGDSDALSCLYDRTLCA
jgi:hypothetical protein